MACYMQSNCSLLSRHSASHGQVRDTYVSAFSIAALSVALMYVWHTVRPGPSSHPYTTTTHLQTLLAMGTFSQWLLGAAIFHFVYARYGHNRQERPLSWLWSRALPALVGAFYGLSCALYLTRVIFQADLPWGFPAHLVLGSVIPSVIFLCLTKEEPLPLPPQCPECSYILFYATEHRCPECGRSFDLSEINTSAVQQDAAGVLQPTPGVMERIHWPAPEEIRRERNWRRLRHPVTALLVFTYAMLIFDIIAPKLNSPGAWHLWLILGMALLVQTLAVVMVLYQEVRQYVLRYGLKGQACILTIAAIWIALLDMAVKLSS